MLVLLPPSEGKAADGPAKGAPALDHGALSLPGLTHARESVLEELVRCAARTRRRPGRCWA